MARRSIRPPSEVGQAGDQRTAAALRAGPARRSYHRPERGGGARARRAVEGPPAWAAAGPAGGPGGGPRTKRPPPAGPPSPGWDHAPQPPNPPPRAGTAKPPGGG